MKLSRRQWNFLIKSGIVLAFGWLLVQRFNSLDDIIVLWEMVIRQWNLHAPWIIVVVLLMMPLNWSLESIKWRLLMRPVVKLSWCRAMAGVLGGITFSLFMPNRIGEYGGRMLFVDAKHAWHTVMASLAGSFAQNVVHISVGLCAAILLFGSSWNLPESSGIGIVLMVTAVIVMSFVAYLCLPAIARVLTRWNPPRLLTRPWKALEHISLMTQKQLLLALLISITRYVIFSTQYILLLRFCGVDISWFWLAGGVAVIYLMHTSIPFPPFVDLIARNELGIFLWAGFGVSEQSIIAAGLMIWILNLAIPALCGLLAIATVNMVRSIGYERETSISSSSLHAPDHAMDRTQR